MAEKLEDLKTELDSLVEQGRLLYKSMLNDLDMLSDNSKRELNENGIKLPNVHLEYDTWYSEALRVIKQIIPERLDDFVKHYKSENRKEIDPINYGVSDYLIGITVTKGDKVLVDFSTALPKMRNQISILKSAKKRFESSLFDIKEVLQADLFDSELEAASELCKKGFIRGAGAIAGVVLEKHLSHVCIQHNLKIQKKHPTISDYNDLLKNNDIIDTSKWRSIQHLGDLRNLCDHQRDREPTKEDVLKLVEGVDEIIKTVH